MCKFSGKQFSPARTASPLRAKGKEEVDKWKGGQAESLSPYFQRVRKVTTRSRGEEKRERQKNNQKENNYERKQDA